MSRLARLPGLMIGATLTMGCLQQKSTFPAMASMLSAMDSANRLSSSAG
jgi:hypothetical protein